MKVRRVVRGLYEVLDANGNTVGVIRRHLSFGWCVCIGGNCMVGTGRTMWLALTDAQSTLVAAA